ncbi:alpha/beta hydrolase-fold protein [Pusillimonas sp. SM2304]|uniref:alpha/beta hydrolase n=1 Tax=Pusillimonas sp. SM2304 TaxID=3073241 RepID=UPI002874E57F|nr:alpha/beta hydrolase-fold protein [Pusillimonas sp. SM2304]MDS1138854.1 alpha/beta hydrolase-fold protein [Pusillimonas sp. SM2304]
MPEHAFLLRSPAGRQHLISLSLPSSAPPPGGWPSAWVLDTPQFDHAVRRLRQQGGDLPGVVIGVGYAQEDSRELDYTPGDEAGRAAQFLSFLQDDVMAEARRRAGLPLDGRRQALCGHSLGALLGLYALRQEAPAFSAYVLSSPSVWWGDRPAYRWAAEVAGRQPWRGAGRVWLSVGEYEQGLSPEEYKLPADEQALQLARRRARRMVDGAHELAGALARQAGLQLHFQVLTGCSHGHAGHQAIAQGWRTVLGA